MKKIFLLVSTVFVAVPLQGMFFARNLLTRAAMRNDVLSKGTRSSFTNAGQQSRPLSRAKASIEKCIAAQTKKCGVKAFGLAVGLYGLANLNTTFCQGTTEVLKENFSLKWKRLNISPQALTELHRLSQRFHIFQCETECSSIEDLKKVLENNHVAANHSRGIGKIKVWDFHDWESAYQTLLKINRRDTDFCVSLEQLPALVEDAKKLLKAFIPESTIFLSHRDQFFVKEDGAGRIFAYAKLKQVIEKDKLEHAHLPLKLLTIKDKKTGKYIVGQQALNIIDSQLQACINPNLEGLIALVNPNYEFVVFAERQERGSDLSEEAFKDLGALVSQAPFDIGYDNIFSDKNGDAVIIDTEFKGECAESSLLKLGRYFPETKREFLKTVVGHYLPDDSPYKK